ncbi:DUF1493 family protein [Pseudogemmobacter humi]|uniref:DUF1493 family protein n=1 Tax=Pseudogemmobacter humi TaxID=2483812 RepID=A0A3P5WZ86_9RHOB|nr:DUF1493 family protein [Pseudogemmobacter humi]VDC23646.1 hypothetical protein XINFAN_01132 [Pseudogemmobacter humi]
MVSEAEVLAWLQPHISRGAEPDPGDILGSLRCDGDNASELFEDFAERFGVDLRNFEPWLYYIADEPPVRRRWHAVDPETGAELPLFPITVQDFVTAAGAGVWNKTHPPHRFERYPFLRDRAAIRRWIRMALVCVLLVVLFVFPDDPGVFLAR